MAGLDPDKDSQTLAPWCPIRNVTADYPATLLIHGTRDTDVPYAQSEAMARELTRARVEHQFITVPEGGHGLGGVKPDVIASLYGRVLAFVDQHMR